MTSAFTFQGPTAVFMLRGVVGKGGGEGVEESGDAWDNALHHILVNPCEEQHRRKQHQQQHLQAKTTVPHARKPLRCFDDSRRGREEPNPNPALRAQRTPCGAATSALASASRPSFQQGNEKRVCSVPRLHVVINTARGSPATFFMSNLFHSV